VPPVAPGLTGRGRHVGRAQPGSRQDLREHAHELLAYVGGVDRDADRGQTLLDVGGGEQLLDIRPHGGQAGLGAAPRLVGAPRERDDPAGAVVALVRDLLDALGGDCGKHRVAGGLQPVQQRESPGREDEQTCHRAGEVAVVALDEAHVAERHLVAEERQRVFRGRR
jgi:hypothetical protein